MRLCTTNANEVTNLAPPDLLKIHPMGKSPLLEDGDVVIAETGAIAEYLMGRYDTDYHLHPRPSSPEFPRYLEWIHAAEGAVFLPGLLQVYFARVDMTGNPAQALMAAEREKAAATIEAHLSKYPYFAGERFTRGRLPDGVSDTDVQCAGRTGKPARDKGMV